MDDPSLVTTAQIYKGQFPQIDASSNLAPEKLNHLHNKYRAILENTLAGKFYHFISDLNMSPIKHMIKIYLKLIINYRILFA